uniref:Ovule protein n=1 Tax=Parascaris univalens TaxID=6257 RepID=A0A915BXU9_PARUN
MHHLFCEISFSFTSSSCVKLPKSQLPIKILFIYSSFRRILMAHAFVKSVVILLKSACFGCVFYFSVMRDGAIFVEFLEFG